MRGSHRLRGGALPSIGAFDLVLAKLAADGTHLWSKRFGNALPVAVAIDAAGNIVVTGWFAGTTDLGGLPLTSTTSDAADTFVVKLASNGTHLWSARFGDTNGQWPTGVAIDATGNIVVSGLFEDGVDFGGGPLTSAGNYDIFVVKLGPDGSHQFSERFGGQGSEYTSGVALDASGDIVVTGFFEGSFDLGGGPLTSEGLSYDVFLARLTADGEYVWASRFGGSDQARSYAVAVDASGNSVLAGSFYLGALDFGGGPLNNAGNEDAFLAKLGP